MIPPLLARNVAGSWPEAGPGWLEKLPRLIDAICADWQLTVVRPHRMTFHWVAEVVYDGQPAVLKLGVPDGHLADETTALRIFDGDGAIRVLAEDAGRGALLMESVRPGTPLAGTAVDDVTATGVLVAAGRRLHRVPPPECTLPHLRAEGDAFRGYLRRFPAAGPMPRRLVERAAELFDDLCATSPGDVVLHGDLHHENVLRGERDRWLVIDPSPRVGDPGWDGGAMLYNPYPERRHAELTRLVPARIEQQADTGDRDRVIAWGFVASAMSEVWSVSSDSDTTTRALDVATLLEKRLT